MVERLFCTQVVEGSSPFRGSKCRYRIKVSIRDFHSFGVGSIPTIYSNIHRGVIAMVASKAHNLEVESSSLSPATNL